MPSQIAQKRKEWQARGYSRKSACYRAAMSVSHELEVSKLMKMPDRPTVEAILALPVKDQAQAYDAWLASELAREALVQVEKDEKRAGRYACKLEKLVNTPSAPCKIKAPKVGITGGYVQESDAKPRTLTKKGEVYSLTCGRVISTKNVLKKLDKAPANALEQGQGATAPAVVVRKRV